MVAAWRAQGMPARDDGLEDLSRDELYERAQRREISGRSSMTKAELIEALREAS